MRDSHVLRQLAVILGFSFVVVLMVSVLAVSQLDATQASIALASKSPSKQVVSSCSPPASQFGPIVNASINQAYTSLGTFGPGYDFSQAPPASLVACEFVVLFNSANSSIQASLSVHNQSFINLTFDFNSNSTAPVASADIVQQWTYIAVHGNNLVPMIGKATWDAYLGTNTIVGPTLTASPNLWVD